ncbi:MAG: cytochrome c [Candidatus Competibacterales bacterium]|nr:cytochrome c [Candidatus Competibacterales bacterium]
MRTLRPSSICLTGALLLGLSAPLHAAEPEDLIKYRQSTMKSLGGHMSAIVAIMREQVDYRDHLTTHSEGLAATSQLVRDVFPPASARGETDAKQAIWDQPEKFAEAVQRLETAAAGFRDAVANDGDTGEALKALGSACKNCHDDFRVKRK